MVRNYISDLEIVEQSEQFIASLDRSVLGRFATHVDLLSAVDLSKRRICLYLAGYAMKDGSHLDMIGIPRNFDLAQYSLADAESELAWWWRSTKEPLWDQYMKRINESTFKRAMLLGLVAHHPDKHDYFAVDIWNPEVIKKMMRDGVDPDLAVSLIH